MREDKGYKLHLTQSEVEEYTLTGKIAAEAKDTPWKWRTDTIQEMTKIPVRDLFSRWIVGWVRYVSPKSHHHAININGFRFVFFYNESLTSLTS